MKKETTCFKFHSNNRGKPKTAHIITISWITSKSSKILGGYNAFKGEWRINIDLPGNHVLERNRPGEARKYKWRSEDRENQLPGEKEKIKGGYGGKVRKRERRVTLFKVLRKSGERRLLKRGVARKAPTALTSRTSRTGAAATSSSSRNPMFVCVQAANSVLCADLLRKTGGRDVWVWNWICGSYIPVIQRCNVVQELITR